jgi:transposase
MKQTNTIGVDLAKNVIQVSILNPSNKEIANKELSRKKFAEFLINQPKSLVVFEACSTAHHWARLSRSYGHAIKIIPAKAVSSFRQGHKTDKNDALAVAEAGNRPNIKVAPLKELNQQSIQSVQRSRELLVQNKTALSNHIRGLLMEFGIFIPKGYSSLFKNLPDVLEDAENNVTDIFRTTLNLMYQRLLALRDDIQALDTQIKQIVKDNIACRNLTNMEGIGPISAILLFSTLGSGEAFKNGREFSAYIGLTPKQHSSGGKVNLTGISKYVANKRVRSVLIQGARAYLYRVKTANTKKDEWLLKLIERVGYGKASVALANKNARTAWALLTQGTEFKKELLI